MQPSFSPESRIAHRAFRDTASHLNDLYDAYRSLYPEVAEVSYSEELLDEYSFNYCLSRNYFVLVVPYTTRKELLVERSFANNRLSWVLVGGSLRSDIAETFIDAAHRLASKTIINLNLGEIEPIAFLKNHFSYRGSTHVHRGVAFVARIRNAHPLSDLQSAIHSRGHFVPVEDKTISSSLTHNATVLELARHYVSSRDLSNTAEFELEENIAYRGRYAFHGFFVKPIVRAVGKASFPYSVNDLQRATERIMMQGANAMLFDVACGENTSILDFARLPGVSLAVGNDVSWSQIQLMGERISPDRLRNLSAMVLFTNHDGRYLPFPDRLFDFVVCKNVLHHMEDYQSVRKLIGEIIRIGKRTLVIEIMDPKYESGWGRLRHQYYMKFLRDAGRNFLSRQEFDALTNLESRRSLFEMATIRGVYQFALFEQPSSSSTSA